MDTQLQDKLEKMVFRKTNTQFGRHISVSPGNSTMRHLAYGRIILNASTPAVSFSNGGHETVVVCLSGSAEVKTGDKSFSPPTVRRDLYSSRQRHRSENRRKGGHCGVFLGRRAPLPCAFRFLSANFEGSIVAIQHRRPGKHSRPEHPYWKECERWPTSRGGFTFSEPGNWTSWPPHEHGKCSKKCTFILTCRSRLMASSLSTTIPDIPNS